MTTPLSPSLYPASYRTSVWKGSLKILGSMAIFLLGVIARTHLIDRSIAPSLLILALVLIFVYFVTILNVTFARVTLYPDHIERTTWFGTKSLLRTDVVKLERRGKFKVVLISKRGLFDSIQLPTGVEEDVAWKAWMAAVPDGNTVPAEATPMRDSKQ